MNKKRRQKDPQITELENAKKQIKKEAKKKIADIDKKIKKRQSKCKHDFKNIKGYDKYYQPNIIHELPPGETIIKKRICKICGFIDLFENLPTETCHLCLSKMIPKDEATCGPFSVTIFQCSDCGHKYEKLGRLYNAKKLYKKRNLKKAQAQ